jgi:hypothetical protein
VNLRAAQANQFSNQGINRPGADNRYGEIGNAALKGAVDGDTLGEALP